MTTRRLLIVHSSSDLYGSDAAAIAVLAEARRADWEVTVTVPELGPLVPVIEGLGGEVLFLDPLKLRRRDVAWPTVLATLGRWFAQWRRLRALARERRFDVVYTSTAPTVGGVILARAWRVRHVYHVHEIFWFPRPLVAGFELVLASADAVICCSRSVAEQFRRRRLTDRCVVAYTGVDVPTGLTESTPLDDLASGRPVEVICVARLNEWKGQEILIEAIAQLRADGRNVRATLVGDVFADAVHHRQRLLDQVERLALNDSIVFAGERRDALALVATADVLVLPSRRPEPFGMALVEGMALGRPVIATDAGGPREIVTNGSDGLLVQPGDPRELADALAGLIDDPAAARAMGEAARRRARDFSLTAMARQVFAALT